VTWEVRRAYLSLMAAREFLYLIDEGRGHLDDAQREIARRLERGDPGAERVDLYRLEAATAEVDVRELQARRLERIALEGLRLLAGLDPAEVIADVPLEPYPLEADSLDGYRELARARRPEIRMVEAGIEAQRRRRRVEWGRWFPDFGLAVSASWVYTAGVDDMHDPKVYDPYNTAGVGAALVMSYPLDFGMDYGRVSEADAEIRRLEAEREALVQAVSVEVVEAWAGLEEASGRMAAQERARTAGRRWFITILQGMTLGLHDAAALTDGLVTYFKGEFEYLSAVYDFNLSWSRLARATGADLLGGLDP
jgi:outer membrane protein TolC